MTASGQAIGRATLVTAFSVTAVDQDCIVNLRNGGVAGPIYWTLEADNATSSAIITFPEGLKFENGVYVEFVTKGDNVNINACIAVAEP